MRLNKHQIYAAVDFKTEMIEIPEWGGEIEIRTMSVGQKFDYDIFVAEKKPTMQELSLYLIKKCCIDDQGKLLFTDEDDEFLLAKSVDSLMRLFEACVDLNRQRASDVEDAAKNS
tara:strand:+ start:12643 stop:12987 length:345 start_codon:yes stop_codon:yes gene_type:complete